VCLRAARNPNGGGDPEWPAGSRNDTYLEIGATTATSLALRVPITTIGMRCRCCGRISSGILFGL